MPDPLELLGDTEHALVEFPEGRHASESDVLFAALKASEAVLGRVRCPNESSEKDFFAPADRSDCAPMIFVGSLDSICGVGETLRTRLSRKEGVARE